MVCSFWTHTITAQRPQMVASRGTMVPDWSNPATTTIGGCNVQTPTTSEVRDGRTATTLLGTVYMPPTADVQAGDRITFDGVTYEVQGEVTRHYSPTGSIAHKQAKIACWKG